MYQYEARKYIEHIQRKALLSIILLSTNFFKRKELKIDTVTIKRRISN